MLPKIPKFLLKIVEIVLKDPSSLDKLKYVSKNKKQFNWKVNPFFIKSEPD